MLSDMRISPSGGSLATMISLFENFQLGELLEMQLPNFLSPVKLRKAKGLRLVYKLPATRPVQYGWLSPLSTGNTCVAYRTWRQFEGRGSLPTYGKGFDCSESLATTSYFSEFFSGLGFALGALSH